MALRAVTAHDHVRVSNVALVIFTVGVLAIPARGEHDLNTETILAVAVEKLLLGQVVAVKGGLGGSGVVEAVEADGTLGKVLLVDLAQRSPVRFGWVGFLRVTGGERTPVGVASKHAEILGETLDLLTIKQIVTLFQTSAFALKSLLILTYASIPPTCSTASSFPVEESLKYMAGVQ